MSKPRISALLVVALSALTFVGAYLWTPRQHLADMLPKVELEAMFPSTFGEWRIDDRLPVQMVSPDQAALLSKLYNQTLSRSYINRRGERIMLSVAYGGDQSDGTRAHRPEVCYPAQGFDVFNSRRVALSIVGRTISARQLESKLGGRYEPVTYWVVVADQTTTSGTEQKLAQLRYGLRGIIPDGMLVRVSSIDRDTRNAFRLQIEFLREMAEAMNGEYRDRVFGAVSASSANADSLPRAKPMSGPTG